MSDALQPFLAPLGIVFGAFLTFLGVRFTARQSRRAAESSTAVSARQVDVGEWQAIVAALREEVKRLSDRVDALEGGKETADAEKRLLLSYTRVLLVAFRREAPNATAPPPPAIFADDLLYITER